MQLLVANRKIIFFMLINSVPSNFFDSFAPLVSEIICFFDAFSVNGRNFSDENVCIVFRIIFRIFYDRVSNNHNPPLMRLMFVF